jgi:hypothetical protein
MLGEPKHFVQEPPNIRGNKDNKPFLFWIPACVGMTGWGFPLTTSAQGGSRETRIRHSGLMPLSKAMPLFCFESMQGDSEG